jgi:Cof subfamily protein (haloacid dehalogenase superfamily)
MRYKLICSDLDDTLIGRKQQFGENLKSSVKEYTDKGGRFCIVTGRMTVGAMPAAKELGLHGELASYQGAVISDIDTGKVVSSNVIDNADAYSIGQYIESKGYYYQTYVGDKFYTETPNSFTEIYGSLCHAQYVGTKCRLSEFIKENRVAPPKILLMGEPSAIPSVTADLRERFGAKFLINRSKPFIIEIVPHGINKGLAVEFVAKRHGINREDVICVGDSENDLTMLAAAGLSVCVANGSEEVKKNVDVIAPDCDDDPVSWVIRKYGLDTAGV